MWGLFTGISICHWHIPSSENLSNECRKSPLALMGMCVPLNDGFHDIKRSFLFFCKRAAFFIVYVILMSLPYGIIDSNIVIYCRLELLCCSG